jgi:hypothetical protein
MGLERRDKMKTVSRTQFLFLYVLCTLLSVVLTRL